MGDTLNFLKMEDDLIILVNGRRPQLFSNVRQPQHSFKLKTNKIQMGNDFHILENGRQPQQIT